MPEPFSETANSETSLSATELQRQLSELQSKYKDALARIRTLEESETETRQELATERSARRQTEEKLVSETIARQQAEQNAATDTLTETMSRQSILIELEKELERTKRGGQGLAVLFVDLDDFKSVNDRYGHPQGDKVLRSFGLEAKHSIRKGDSVGRYGGEEFVILLPISPDATPEEIMKRTEILHLNASKINRSNKNEDDEPQTLSVGIAFFRPGTNITIEEAIKIADNAEIFSKTHGKACTTLAYVDDWETATLHSAVKSNMQVISNQE